MNAENAGPPNRVTVVPSSARRASRGASRLSPALLAEARPLRFRCVERSSSDCAPVHDHVDIVPPGPRHSRRVNGKRERRLQLARSERHTSQLEHLRRAHSASLDEMHGHIDEKLLLSCRVLFSSNVIVTRPPIRTLRGRGGTRSPKPLRPCPSPFVCGSPHAYSRAVGSSTRHPSGFPGRPGTSPVAASSVPPLGE